MDKVDDGEGADGINDEVDEEESAHYPRSHLQKIGVLIFVLKWSFSRRMLAGVTD